MDNPKDFSPGDIVFDMLTEVHTEIERVLRMSDRVYVTIADKRVNNGNRTAAQIELIVPISEQIVF